MKTIVEFEHINATSLDEAAAALAEEGTMATAGGTDIIGTLRFSVLPDALYPTKLVNLKSIPGLDYIKEEGGTLKIGALTRLEDIAINTTVKTKYSCLAEAARKTASPHIREMGTIGGNICQMNRCWYFRCNDNRFDCIRKGGNMCFAMMGDNRYHSIFGAIGACIAVNPSDTAPALVALDATVITTRREIAAGDFWAVAIPGSTVLEKDEIVKEIQIPAPASGVKSWFVKMAIRKAIDFPIVNCAAAIGGGNARICLNAVYNNPYRATKAEDAIKGKAITMENAEAAAEAGLTGTSPMAASGSNPGNKWKVSAAKGVMKQAIMGCA
ncbi:MAG: FAD binding domain-containing protein [Dehalococcoidales bacterium]